MGMPELKTAYEYSLEIVKHEIRHKVTNVPSAERNAGPDFVDFLPLVVFAALLLIALIILTGFKISKILEKKAERESDDPPPSYPELDIVVPAPIGPHFVHASHSSAPPSYELAVAGDQPPPYTFVNVAFEPDPPAYSSINVQTTINTHHTTVFAV